MKDFSFSRACALIKYDALVYGRNLMMMYAVCVLLLLLACVPLSAIDFFVLSALAVMPLACVIATTMVLCRKFSQSGTATSYTMLPATTVEKGVVMFFEYFLTCVVGVALLRVLGNELCDLMVVNGAARWKMDLLAPLTFTWGNWRVLMLELEFYTINFMAFVLLTLHFRRFSQLKAIGIMGIFYWLAFWAFIWIDYKGWDNGFLAWSFDHINVVDSIMLIWGALIAVLEVLYFFHRLRTREIK